MFTIENKNLKKNWEKKLSYFALTLFSQLLPHIAHCSGAEALDEVSGIAFSYEWPAFSPEFNATQDLRFSQMMSEIISENSPHVCGPLIFRFDDNQDGWSSQISERLACQQKTNLGGKTGSKIGGYLARSPYVRPTTEVRLQRFLIASAQEKEGQHDLANYNYHLSYLAELSHIRLEERGEKIRKNKRIRAQSRFSNDYEAYMDYCTIIKEDLDFSGAIGY